MKTPITRILTASALILYFISAATTVAAQAQDHNSSRSNEIEKCSKDGPNKCPEEGEIVYRDEKGTSKGKAIDTGLTTGNAARSGEIEFVEVGGELQESPAPKPILSFGEAVKVCQAAASANLQACVDKHTGQKRPEIPRR